MKDTDKVTLTVGQLKKLLKEGTVHDDYIATAKLSLVRRAFEYLFSLKMQDYVASNEFEEFAMKNFNKALPEVRKEGTYADAEFELDEGELQKLFANFVKEKQKDIEQHIEFETKPHKFNW